MVVLQGIFIHFIINKAIKLKQLYMCVSVNLFYRRTIMPIHKHSIEVIFQYLYMYDIINPYEINEK